MSTRALRKQAQANAKNSKPSFDPETEDVDENEESEDESTVKSRQKIRNFFALLDDGEDNENDAVGEVVEAAEEDDKAAAKKKKKKAKSKKSKSKQQQPATSTATDDDFLMEASLQAECAVNVKADQNRKRNALLRIEAKYLLADLEIRKRFGAGVSEQLQQDRVPRHLLRINTHLTRLKMNWPQFTKLGIDMIVKETKKVDGRDVQIFEYRHSKDYEAVQQRFWAAVHSHDPNTLTNLHHVSPYHIDTLLQLSEMLRISDSHSEAADVVERALFALEASAHPQFSLTNVASCKLDYAKRENRALFVALFLHSVSLARRSCYRTALEISKVLMQLDAASVASDNAESAGDPDPLGASLAVDFYALKANEADWLIEWYETENQVRCLYLLPNFAYSIALALHTKAQRVAKQRNAPQSSSGTKSAAEWQAQADSALRYALLQFPGVLNALLERLSVQPDAYIEQHPYFAPLRDRYRDPRELKQLEALYASRCAPLWKGELNWLEESTRHLCNDLDAFKAGKAAEPPSDSSAPVQPTDCSLTAANLERFERLRQTSFQRTPRNVLRHLILSECRPALEHAASYLANLTITSYDPLPPNNSYEAYSYQPPDRASQQRNLLQLFFESLMPGYNPEAEPAPEDQAGGVENAVRGTVNALRDALRAVMDNMHQNPPANLPADPDANANADADDFDYDDAEWQE